MKQSRKQIKKRWCEIAPSTIFYRQWVWRSSLFTSSIQACRWFLAFLSFSLSLSLSLFLSLSLSLSLSLFQFFPSDQLTFKTPVPQKKRSNGNSFRTLIHFYLDFSMSKSEGLNSPSCGINPKRGKKHSSLNLGRFTLSCPPFYATSSISRQRIRPQSSFLAWLRQLYFEWVGLVCVLCEIVLHNSTIFVSLHKKVFLLMDHSMPTRVMRNVRGWLCTLLAL